MRVTLLTLVLFPAVAAAQTQSADTSTPAAPPVASAPVTPAEVSPDDRAKPLASSRTQGPVLSKNEAYNLARAAEGRVGVRLGNDVSYRVTGN